MKKIILSLLLVLTLTFSVVSGFAAEIEYTNETDGVYMTPVTITASGSDVVVSMSAKIPEGDAQKLMFIASLYEEKTLVGAAVQTNIVDANGADFSVSLTGASGDYEINAALVSTTDNLMPKGTPANYPAKDGADTLRDLKVNGESVFDKLNENNEVNVSIMGSVTDYSEIDVMPYTMDSSSIVNIEDGTGEFPDRQTLTVTDTKGNSTDYTILYKYRVHYVVGAEDDSDFTEADPGFSNSFKSDPVATVVKASDGCVYTNFHEYVDSKDVGSRASNDGAYTAYAIGKIHDESLKGADYFTFELGGSASLGPFNNNPGHPDLVNYTGNLLEFDVMEDVQIAIVTTEDINFDTNGQGYVETNGDIVDVYQNITADGNPGANRQYKFKYTRNFKKGHITIPYVATDIGKSRFPFIFILPADGEFVEPELPDIVDLTFPVNGMSYEDYIEYSGEEKSDELAAQTTGILSFNLGQGKDFDIGSEVGPNDQRKVSIINDDTYGITGAEYIRFFNGYAYNQGGNEAMNWVAEAYSGVDTTGLASGGEMKSWWGFEKDVVWSTFSVTKDCNVVIVSQRELSSVYEDEEGYEKTTLTDPIITTERIQNGAVTEIVEYKNVYVKPFSAGDTVNIYNTMSGYTDHLFFVIPTGE